MSNITAEKLAEALNLIMNSEKEEPKKEAETPAKETEIPTKAELRAEILAELRAEAEENKKKAEAEREQAKEEINHAAERENKFIAKSLTTSVGAHGVSADVVESLSEFIEYDRLKNDEGEADEEKIESLATLISNISNRKPPKTGKKRDVFDNGGFSKYLPKN